MPIYEYACSVCGGLTEELQKHNEVPPKECPYCKNPDTLSKEVSKPSLIKINDGSTKV